MWWEKIDSSLIQDSYGLVLIVWEEVSKTFLDFLMKCTSSPYKNLKVVFSRRGYQWNSVNIAHAHIIIAVYWVKLSEEGNVFVIKKRGRSSVLFLLYMMILRMLLQIISFQVNIRYTRMLNQPLLFLLTNLMIDVWLKH